MTDFDDPDDPLTLEEEARARLLTDADLRRIDQCLLTNTSQQWRKVARVIALTMQAIHDDFPGIPDVFYSLRIKRLAETGAIEAAAPHASQRNTDSRFPNQKLKARSQELIANC